MKFEGLDDLESVAREVWRKIPKQHREVIEQRCVRVCFRHGIVEISVTNEAEFDLLKKEITIANNIDHFGHSNSGWRGVFAHEFGHAFDGQWPLKKKPFECTLHIWLQEKIYIFGEYSANRNLKKWGFAQDYICTEQKNPSEALQQTAKKHWVTYDHFLGERFHLFPLSRILCWIKSRGWLKPWGVAR